jgi:RND family efflux transporter MFP subunit
MNPLFRFSAGTVATMLLLILAACGEGKPQSAAVAPVTAGESLVLAMRQVPDRRSVPAQVTTRDLVEVAARIPGTLSAHAVREGDTVQAGQLLLRIADARLGHEASAATAQVGAARAEADRAAADLARIRDLYDKQVYARARLEQAVATEEAAAARLAAAQAQERASRAVVDEGRIVAPAAGRVLRLPLPAGAVVAPGTVVAVLTAGPPVLRLELPESLAGRIPVGAAVTVDSADLPGAGSTGRVVQVYPGISGGRVRVDAEIEGLAAEFVGRRVAATVEAGQTQ